MQITEIYKSIQGESTYAGLPCIFVRLTGCNLRCSWCDSEYTFTGGHRKTLEEVVEEVEQLSPDGGLVEIAGGEPMLQERSEERRVGKECRSRGSPNHEKKKKSHPVNRCETHDQIDGR